MSSSKSHPVGDRGINNDNNCMWYLATQISLTVQCKAEPPKLTLLWSPRCLDSALKLCFGAPCWSWSHTLTHSHTHTFITGMRLNTNTHKHARTPDNPLPAKTRTTPAYIISRAPWWSGGFRQFASTSQTCNKFRVTARNVSSCSWCKGYHCYKLKTSKH